MFDPLKKEKQQLHQANIEAELATQYTQAQYQAAKLASKRFLSSPTGIATSFAAGSMTAASSNVSPTKPSPSTSSLMSLLLKLL